MIERAAGQQPAKPVTPPTQPARVDTGEMPQELVHVTKDIQNFIDRKGHSLLGAGTPHEYSNRPIGDLNRVSRFISSVIVHNKKP